MKSDDTIKKLLKAKKPIGWGSAIDENGEETTKILYKTIKALERVIEMLEKAIKMLLERQKEKSR